MEASTALTSRSLVLSAQQGDPLAWQQLVTLYVPLVLRWIRGSAVEWNDALDVTQNVFLSVARDLPKFRHEGSQPGLRGWLRTITRNATTDWYRARRRTPKPLSPDYPAWVNLFSETSDEQPAEAERLLVLRQAAEIVRGEFEPATWEMFWEIAADGRSADAIAADRSVTPWAVYKAKSRVLTRLKELLANFSP